jgi:membrane dipeptidase
MAHGTETGIIRDSTGTDQSAAHAIVGNLDDTQLSILAKSGGLVGVSFVPDFIDQDFPTIKRLVDHIDHICEIGGIDAVGIGSDFDGGGDLLTDAREIAAIVEELDRRNYSEESIRKILGGNTMRVLEAAIG